MGYSVVTYFFDRINYNDEERVGHGEQHPDIDHLDVSCARQISGYPDKAEIEIKLKYPGYQRIFTRW